LSVLDSYAAQVYSQDGEDGILERILELIGEHNRWCIEFGAWDGLHLSNCANLIHNHGYSGVLIEANGSKFAALEANYRSLSSVTTINAFVGFSPDDNLDALLSDVSMPDDPDVLSIDIDGNDYHAWAAIERLQPKVVCIEFNSTIPNAVDFVQAADPAVQQGCGVRSLVRLGKEKGYELTCCTTWNAIFVDARYFSRLGIETNSVDALRDDSPFTTYLSSGYDGHVILSGYRRLPWHKLPVDERKVQQIPRWLARYPDDYSAAQRLGFRVYRRLRRGRAEV
jgi:hypothetical protein